MLEIAKAIEYLGETKFTLDILNVIVEHFEANYQSAVNGYPLEGDGKSKYKKFSFLGKAEYQI